MAPAKERKMIEQFTGLGVKTLGKEIDEPGNPELKRVGWRLKNIITSGNVRTGSLVNESRGIIKHVVVRMMTAAGKIIVWDQPVFEENPGLIMAPVRRIASGKAQKEDQVIVYMIVVQRPIVRPAINIPLPGGLAKGFSKLGITSIEFPRGISDNRFSHGFHLSKSFKSERIQLLGDQSAFEASGGFEEMGEEVPELRIHPGYEPIIVSGINPNTTYFETTPGGFIVPICPDIRSAEEKVDSSTAQAELIKDIIFLRYPEETDQILTNSERMVRTGAWDSNTPILVDSFTQAMLTQIGRLVRENRIPVTG